jgi:hypothetical protein
LKESENRVLRGMFGHDRKEETEDWRKVHKEELITCTLCQTFLG